MLVGFIIIFIAVADYKIFVFTAYLIGLAILAIYLYSFKTKGPTTFYLIKVPLNIICNAFLIILLLKSWTMRGFKKDLAQLDEQQGEKEAT